MTVRLGAPGDASAIAEVHVRSWQVGYRGQLPDELLDSLDPARRLPRWVAALSDASWPERGVLVVEDGGRLLGFAHLCPTRDPDQDPGAVGEISSFYVDPQAWNRGLGGRLMDACLDHPSRSRSMTPVG